LSDKAIFSKLEDDESQQKNIYCYRCEQANSCHHSRLVSSQRYLTINRVARMPFDYHHLLTPSIANKG
jgi:hypothetical protein